MSLMNIKWQDLQIKDPTKLKPSIEFLHRSAQFPALFGNSLLPKAEDDSQASLEWVPELYSLVGQVVELDQPVRMALNYEKYELHVLNDKLQAVSILPLTGQTKSQVMGYLKQITKKLGGDPNKIEPITHYELPDHETDHKGVFQVLNPAFVREMARYRTNIRNILETIKPNFKDSTPIRVWPHHFDTGMVIEADKEKTVGMGLAMPDDIAPEPYFYINHWIKKGDINYDDLSPLPGGGTWTKDDRPMAILRMSQILKRDDATQQTRQIAHFFVEGINTSLELIGAKKLQMEGETTA